MGFGYYSLVIPMTTTETTIVKRLPPRSDISTADSWDLSSLYESDEAWEAAFEQFPARIERYAEYTGMLSGNVAMRKACLDLDLKIDRLGERLGTYAFLKTTEDQANSNYQGMF